MNEILLNKQRQHLKMKAHHLKPVIMIGSKGLTEPVHKELDIALNVHELIKVKVLEHDKDDIKLMVEALVKKHKAHYVQTMGHTITLYRKRKED
jgi:RNA-binding protein